MKLSPRTKKLLTLLLFVTVAVTLTGCTIPTDEDGNRILIDTTTTFSEIMGSENFFSALFVWPLAQIINHLTPHIGVGLAIAVITIIVNGILAVATLRSTVATQKMQLIQPELEKIQRKYEGRDDAASRNRMAQETQNLYAKYNINPFTTMIVAFIQFPIIIAMYQAVQRSTAVQNGTFLGLNLQTTPLAGIREGQFLYIVLFAIMGIAQIISMNLPQYFSKKRAEKIAAKQHRKPEKTSSNQNRMMQIYMTGMILVFGFTWPTAMSLYWAINSTVNIIKTIAVQKYIDHLEEKEGTKR